jgi:hypothetical protein
LVARPTIFGERRRRRRIAMPFPKRRAGLLVLTAAVAVSAFVVVPTAAAAGQVPFAAAMTGSVTATAPCGVLTLCLTVTDEGTATHLGLGTLTKSVTIHIGFTPCDGGGVLTTYTEAGTLTAANGDTLTVSGGGTACAANGHAIGTGELTVTGGTGRFAGGASGSLAESFDHNLVTDTEVVDLSGTISAPGSG